MNTTTATSFADPADIEAYNLAKAEGKTEQEALAVGDNGIGAWGDNTKQGSGARSSLPHLVIIARWGNIKQAENRLVRVWFNGQWQDTILSDIGPGDKEVAEGHGLDLNFDAWAFFGITPPCSHQVQWEWTEDAVT